MFETFNDEERNLVTFVTDNINKNFIAQKELEHRVDKYDKFGPIPEKSDSDKNKWVMIYYKKGTKI